MNSLSMERRLSSSFSKIVLYCVLSFLLKHGIHTESAQIINIQLGGFV